MDLPLLEQSPPAESSRGRRREVRGRPEGWGQVNPRAARLGARCASPCERAWAQGPAASSAVGRRRGHEGANRVQAPPRLAIWVDRRWGTGGRLICAVASTPLPCTGFGVGSSIWNFEWPFREGKKVAWSLNIFPARCGKSRSGQNSKRLS